MPALRNTSAVAPVPSPVITASGTVLYPLPDTAPPPVTVIAVIQPVASPFAMVAVAVAVVAPEGASNVTVGAEVYPDPAAVNVIVLTRDRLRTIRSFEPQLL